MVGLGLLQLLSASQGQALQTMGENQTEDDFHTSTATLVRWSCAFTTPMPH
jgi:hypothetical protein